MGELHSLALAFGISDLYIDVSTVSGFIEPGVSRSQPFHLPEGRWRLLVLWEPDPPIFQGINLLPSLPTVAVLNVNNPWENVIDVIYPIRGSIDRLIVGPGGGSYVLRTMGASDVWGLIEMIFPGIKVSFWMVSV